MAKRTAPLLSSTNQLLVEFGERLKLARLRRKLTAKQVAERAGMSPMTLRSLEAGGAGVTVGAYLSVMQILGLEQDLAKMAAEDKLGRRLQDARLVQRGTTSLVKPAVRKKPISRIEGTGQKEVTRDPGIPHVDDQAPGSTGITSKALASLLKPSKQPHEGSDKK